VALADTIRRRIRSELGITISVGVSFNKVFAKLGSDYRKPDATTQITRENFRSMVWPLPVGDLLYVGHAAKNVFHRFQINTIGGLAVFDRDALFTMLGKNGAQLHDFANGLDHASVAPAGLYTPPKSVGNGMTFPKNLCGPQEIRAGITLLSDQVAARLRGHGMKCCCVSLSVRDPDFRDSSRQKQILSPTNLSREIARYAWELAQESWNMNNPVRALTVTALTLIPEGQAGAQMDFLGETDQTLRREKLERLENTMDSIRAKFGKGAIAAASTPSNTRKERHAPPPGGHYEVE
jgi:DNA polymerase-4